LTKFDKFWILTKFDKFWILTKFDKFWILTKFVKFYKFGKFNMLLIILSYWIWRRIIIYINGLTLTDCCTFFFDFRIPYIQHGLPGWSQAFQCKSRTLRKFWNPFRWISDFEKILKTFSLNCQIVIFEWSRSKNSQMFLTSWSTYWAILSKIPTTLV